MTEYWVSQGNKWCDFCKIFLSNNPSSIRNHELGQRHKDSVAQRLTTMRQEKVAKEKAVNEAARALEQIEAKAKRSYQKDVATLKEAGDARALDILGDSKEKWDFDSTSGYYYNNDNGLHYDPNSGFYYSDAIGKWVTDQEAYAAVKASANGKHQKPSVSVPISAKPKTSPVTSGPPPGPVVSASLNPTRSVKGKTSAVTVNKRKREEDKKPKVLSQEDKAALRAREAAKKRVEDREKGFHGLYGGKR